MRRRTGSARSWLLAAVLARHTTRSTATPCSPNLCSGHGSCESAGARSTPRQCLCVSGWFGADCSLKSCPTHAAWDDIASANEVAHGPAECANRGACDRLSGECACDAGYEGQACERLSCPARCSGHGQCQSMSYYAHTKDPGEGPVFPYDTRWDAAMIYGCACDKGFSGPDCSIRLCPTGDDPLTGGQRNEQQAVTCAATGGAFTLAFRGFTTAPIAAGARDAAVRDALQALPSVYAAFGAAVAVSYASGQTAACTAAGHTWKVEFLQDFGNLPLLVPNGAGLSHTSGTKSITAAEVVAGEKENLPCSGRGLCDSTTGICECEPEMDTSDGLGAPGRRGDCGHAALSVTHCPGEVSCSGHGVCAGAPTYACLCADGWRGADCSLKACPRAKAWFARPAAAEAAHVAPLAECAGAGACDAVTGECACVPGFEGAACARMMCPAVALPSAHAASTLSSAGSRTSRASEPGDVCSGRGQCLTMSQLAAAARTPQGAPDPRAYGAVPNDPAAWDWDMVQGCLCDAGYAGHACELRRCARGDDPQTGGQRNEVQRLRCVDAGAAVTGVMVQFRGAYTAALGLGATAAQIKAALEALDTIDDVTVSCGPTHDALCATTGDLCTVEFLTDTGDLPEMTVTNAGNGAVAVRADTLQQGTREDDVCSHRGLCNEATGECECFAGFGSSDGRGGQGTKGDCGYMLPFALPPLELDGGGGAAPAVRGNLRGPPQLPSAP
ncbi:tenascin-like protein [Tribonema minus]|uniref:Tenascin-like protein n=1 Tax=Tribonema minus TaxID=303371 RepID=A0A835Z2P2_9STRA|nr:tenascin-like protein [Tribonema minus]